MPALEQQALGQRQGLALVRGARDLHQNALARRQPLGRAQESRLAIGQVHEDPTQSLDRPAHHAAQDGAGRDALAFQRQVLQHPVHHQRRDLAPADLSQRDHAALHARHPAAARSAAVSASGRPTIALKLP